MSKIVIHLGLRRLYHYENNRLVKDYPIAIGKPATPTPTGEWQVIAKIKHPGGILGTRWLGLDIPNGPYGIHGTPNPWTIGKAISHGCIRMYNQDVEALFPQIKVGTSVKIIHSWNENVPEPDSSPAEPPHALQPGSPSPPAIQPPSSSGQRTYIVKDGDTLWLIARRFNVTLSDLIAKNNLANPNLLEVGQQLILPA